MAVRNRLLPGMEWVPMPLGRVIYETGAPLRFAYFPECGIVSLIYVTESGETAELAVIGAEGVVGMPLLSGRMTMPHRAVVQGEGRAVRVPAAALREAFDTSPGCRDLLLRFTQALLCQVAQTAVCNRHHSLSQHLCRWLLLSFDRLRSDTLEMTHELIAQMLGVRRESVTTATSKLQAADLIRHSRGRIRLLDRPGLEARCCECYHVIRKEYDRLLPRARGAP